MKKINISSILLIAGILLLLNVISQSFFHRFDLTADKQYTLSNATKDILQSLENPVTVSAYFSEDLPPDLQKIRKDFQEMLVEYSNTSKGMVDYQFVNPNESPEKEQEAGQNGIRPVMINIREKDQSKQQRAYLGAVLKMGDQQPEIIPVISTGSGMEYSLTTSIKKLSVLNKPIVGIVQGHGEPALQDLAQVYQSLSILYSIEPVDLSSPDLSRFKALAIVAPKDSMPPSHFANLDLYLQGGGSLFVGINRVEGNLQNQTGSAVTTGLEYWLAGKGINVEASFILDAQCGSVTVQQRQGFFYDEYACAVPIFAAHQFFPRSSDHQRIGAGHSTICQPDHL